ncbi:hypothetical protein X975_06442, partial [Stegodyphus mimosarum]
MSNSLANWNYYRWATLRMFKRLHLLPVILCWCLTLPTKTTKYIHPFEPPTFDIYTDDCRKDEQ